MTTYHPHLWKRASWQKRTRYYHCELRQNLFADWIVVRSWGDNRSNRGREMEHICDNFEEAKTLFNEVEIRRKKRHYKIVSHR